MLQISKKKLLISNLILLAGLAGICVGILFVMAEFSYARPVVVASCVVCIAGVLMKDSLYRCPECRAHLIKNSVVDMMTTKYASTCPDCGKEIKVERV